MKGKLLALVLAGAMLLCLLTTPLSSITMAAGETLIDSIDDLKNIKNAPGGSYLLTADIDLAGVKWDPLPAFSGTLDGGDHIIRNLAITDTTDAGDDSGLFATITDAGKVCNLGMEGVNITARNNTGGIAGTNFGTISRCYITGTVSGGEYAGGIVGTNSGTIVNCYSRASVSGKNYLGGLAGSNSGTIEKSYAASAVTDSVMNNYLQFNADGYNTDNPNFLHYGSGGYVTISNIDAYKVSAFTLEAWFQWDNYGSYNTEFIIGKGVEQFEIHTGGGSLEDGLRFIPIPDDASRDYGGYPNDSYIDVHNVLQSGWFHVAAVYSYDSTNINNNIAVQVYVNGEAQDLWQIPSASAKAAQNVGKTAYLTRTANPLVNNIDAINIGRRTDGSLYFDGKIADVRFWNIARTAEQIKACKDKMLTGTLPAELVGYWKLNEASGVTANDSTAKGNNGTLENYSNTPGTPGTVTRVTVSAGGNKGGLTGGNTGSIVTDCFYDSALYGSTGGEGTAKPTTDMKNPATYAGWDSAIWDITAGSYPNLRFKTATTVTVVPASAIVAKGVSKTFTATVAGTNSPVQTVTWSITGNTSASTKISGSGVLSVGSDETATSLTVKATSTADTAKSGTAMVTVTEQDPTVTTVTVSPASASVVKGGTQQFSATVAGTGSPAQTVEWTVENGTAGTSINASGLLTVASDETAASLTVKATSAVNSSVSGTAAVTVTAAAANPSAGSGSYSSGSYTPSQVTVYNDPSIPRATVWLTGEGIAADDKLITETLSAGENFSAVLHMADGGEVFKTYNIYLQSGRKSTGSAMHITFDLSAEYAGQAFTLVHEKDDGTYEYFYAAADGNGDLTFGPLYTLSPFMLVKGTLSKVPAAGIPVTGDSPALWAGILLMAGAALTAGFAMMRKKGF